MSESTVEHLPKKGVFRLRGLEMTRLETFTDAAFAFALTLLVISIDPPTTLEEMLGALRGIPAFISSGAMLMVFWWGHHEWSRKYGLDDGPAVWLSCLLVFTVLVYVVPLRFMFGIFFSWIGMLTGLPIGAEDLFITGPQDLHTIFLIYGTGFTSMAGSLVLLHVHAWRQSADLELSPVEKFETLAEAGVWGIVAATGAVSAITALVLEPSAWGLPGWVYMSLMVTTPIFGKATDRRRKALEEAATG